MMCTLDSGVQSYSSIYDIYIQAIKARLYAPMSYA